MYPQVFPCPNSTRGQVGWAGSDDFHNGGFDIFGTDGDPVLAPINGEATRAGWNDGGGYRIGITDMHGVYHYLAHNREQLLVGEGQQVSAGQHIAFMSNTATGGTSPHVHYALRDQSGNWFENDWYSELISVFNAQGGDDMLDVRLDKLLNEWTDRQIALGAPNDLAGNAALGYIVRQWHEGERKELDKYTTDNIAVAVGKLIEEVKLLKIEITNIEKPAGQLSPETITKLEGLANLLK